MKKPGYKRGYLIVPVFLFLMNSFILAENPDTSLYKILQNINQFEKAAESLNINTSVLMSVVYVERTLNVDWQDESLDIILARSGYNSSIGLCQVKLKTAYFIEKSFSDTTSIFYPGEEYTNIFQVSKTPEELIVKLSNDSINIFYAAAYLRLIQSFWGTNANSIDEKPDIIGTLYSVGLYDQSGRLIMPHSNPKANYFGLQVLNNLPFFKRMFLYYKNRE